MTEASGLEFERAEPAAGATEGLRCAACAQPIVDAYWQVNAAVACEKCKNLVARELATRRPGRFFLAGLYGTLAAGAGAAVWYAVRAATDYEFGLLAIAIGFGVGYAVRKGGQGRGGWAYQALAIFLTYMAIVSTYVPLIVKSFAERGEADVVAMIVSLGFAMAFPFMAGLENLMGLAIIAFGLYEAWKINKAQPLTVTGPFDAKAAPAGEVPAVG